MELTAEKIALTTSGDATVISAVASRKLQIWRLVLIADGAAQLTFKSGSTALSGAISLAANQELKLLMDSEPWFTTNNGEAFVINSSANETIGGMVYYTEQ